MAQRDKYDTYLPTSFLQRIGIGLNYIQHSVDEDVSTANFMARGRMRASKEKII